MTQTMEAGNATFKSTEQLIRDHIKFVKYLASPISRAGVLPLDDLIQVGLEALVRWADKYDPSRGVKFTTFIGRYISGAMLRANRDYQHLPRRLHERVGAYLKFRERWSESREATDEEAAQAIGTTPEIAAELRQSLRWTRSLDETVVTSGGKPFSLPDCLSNGEASLEENVCDTEFLRAALQQLTERERQAIALYFFEEKYQSEIARILGVSQMQAGRILRTALDKMRAWSEEEQHAGQ